MSYAMMIPSASRKMVQNLKEVVNCSEEEIYAMLKECSMDPTETVHRLLNQDTFHEVKSKRKQKKETKDGPEYRTRSVNNYHAQSSSRGGRSSSSYYSSTDYGTGYGNPVPKNESEMSATGNSSSRMSTPTLHSEATSIQNKQQSHATIDNDAPSLSQPPEFQNSWSKSVVQGQMSMADIVRLGTSQIKPSTVTTDANPIKTSISPTKGTHIISTPQELADPVVHNEEKSQCSFHNDWVTVNHAEISSVDPSAFSTLHVDETSKFEREPYLDENQIHGVANEDSQTESIQSESSYDEVTISRNSGDQDDSPLSGIDSDDSCREEVEDANLKLSSDDENLHELNLPEERFGINASTEDKPAVIIPSHLQVTCADLSHLSFGSFCPNKNNSTRFGSLPSNLQINNTLDTTASTDKIKFDQSNSRNTGHDDNDQLKTTIDNKATNTTSYNIPSVSQPEFGHEMHNVRGNFLPSSDYAFPSTTQSSPAYDYSDLSVQMQNLNPFPALMQPHSNSMPSNLLTTNSHHPLQGHDLPFTALQKAQSVNAQYNGLSPSFGQPNFMPEVKLDAVCLGNSSTYLLPSGHPFVAQDYTYFAQFMQPQAAAEAAAVKYKNALQSVVGHGNFNLDPSVRVAGAHYKDGPHRTGPVQHDNSGESAVWLEQALLRSIQGQRSAPPGLTERPNLYQPQGGPAQQQYQQRNGNGGSMAGAQGRMWRDPY